MLANGKVMSTQIIYSYSGLLGLLRLFLLLRGLLFHSNSIRSHNFPTIGSAIDFDCFQLNMNGKEKKKQPNIGVAFKFGE